MCRMQSHEWLEINLNPFFCVTKLWKGSPISSLFPAWLVMQSLLEHDRSENWSGWTSIQKWKIYRSHFDWLKFDSMCILKLAQRRPWLYITYWSSLPNHHSFSHFEPELCSSLQFGGGACAEVLCLINKELSYWKNQPIKESSQNSWSSPAWPQHG